MTKRIAVWCLFLLVTATTCFALFGKVGREIGKGFRKVGGAVEDIGHFTEKAFETAVKQPAKVLVHSAGHVVGAVLPVKKARKFIAKRTETSVEGRSSHPFTMTSPVLQCQEGQFRAHSEAELRSFLTEVVGLDHGSLTAELASKLYFQYDKQTKVTVNGVNAGPNVASARVAIVTTHQGEGCVLVFYQLFQAESVVSATDTIHWREVVRHLGNNQEHKHDQQVCRGLTDGEVQQVQAALLSAIYADNHWDSIPTFQGDQEEVDMSGYDFADKAQFAEPVAA